MCEENVDNSQEIGKTGEEIAKKYLLENNYKIVAKNFRCKFGEIDIIAYDKEELVFIEVKTRTSDLYGTPASAVNKTKIKHMTDAARVFLRLNKFNKYEIRFDVIEIFIKDGKCKINHIKQII